MVDGTATMVIKMIAEAVAEEREACAKIAEEQTMFLSCSPDGHGIAAKIRDRSKS